MSPAELQPQGERDRVGQFSYNGISQYLSLGKRAVSQPTSPLIQMYTVRLHLWTCPKMQSGEDFCITHFFRSMSYYVQSYTKKLCHVHMTS